jgi:ACT domain-containing protein
VRVQDERAVLTVLGVDRIGIVARVSGVLAEHGVNIEDIRMTLMDDLFTMIALLDLAPATAPFATIQESLHRASQDLGVQVLVQRELLFRAMHRV